MEDFRQPAPQSRAAGHDAVARLRLGADAGGFGILDVVCQRFDFRSRGRRRNTGVDAETTRARLEGSR